YFEQGDDAALKLLKRAADLAPGSAAVLDSYGWVLAKSGRVDEGLVYLEKANQLSPENQEIADHLAAAKKM
ncbi:MAG: Tfp pilus assembly protein PilF, partial [Oleiphilaceae bacterium]